MKRIFDVLVSLSFLLGLFPILIVLYFLVRINLGSPVIFIQRRPGLNGTIFNMLKFRSMSDGVDKNGNLLSDEERLTRFGLTLRKSSLDELPGLFNVVLGHMSLVGPRPLLVEYLPLYSKEQSRRHSVRPGITGWAQVNGRNALTWKEKFDLDLWYIDNRNFSLDIKILLMTVKKVFMREGVSHAGEATMSKFEGNKK